MVYQIGRFGLAIPRHPSSSGGLRHVSREICSGAVNLSAANMGIMGTVNAHEDDEHELIDRAKAGETIAFERLAGQHAAPLWRCALALGKDRHWAEDLAQETLVEAWRSLARFDGRCRFSTWLYGILRHRFLKGRRGRNAVRLSASDALGQEQCTACSPDQSAEVSEDAQRFAER